MSAAWVVSIVSHGHGPQALALLRQLAALPQPWPARVVLTLNRPEPDHDWQALQAQAWPFELVLHINQQAQGFGANHNQAFALYAQPLAAAGQTPAFAVLNPDVQLHGNPWPALLAALAAPGVGCVWPQQVDAQGRLQDHERALPTPASIAARALWFAARRLGRVRRPAPGQARHAPDWANAAFWLVRAAAWRDIGGFDTRYFMYGEDVDFCLRLQLAGLRLAGAPACVTHAAQRASHASLRHFLWHARSLWRLWRSPAYAAYRRMKAGA